MQPGMTHLTPFLRPNTLAEAVTLLHEGGGSLSPLAGATWIMRQQHELDNDGRGFVSLDQIPELRSIATKDDTLVLGACLTHAMIATVARQYPSLSGLFTAAERAATPAIRNRATLGGNLCTHEFASADLPPSLLALDATAVLASPGGEIHIILEDFLAQRDRLPPGVVLQAVRVPLDHARRSGHARLPLRRAGDYPVAIVSVSAAIQDGRLRDTCVAVGAVEIGARRWGAAESLLEGASAQAKIPEVTSEDLSCFVPREGPEAPGWYRVQVLRRLLQNAVDALANREGGEARCRFGSM